MVKTASWAVVIGAIAALGLGGCTNPQEMSDMKAKVEEVQAQQKDILTKLDDLAKGQKQILAKAPAAAAAPARPTEDPNQVYDIPVAKSFVKGPEDASVTIIEFSDFQ